jgi:hypothetical protein
LIDAQGDEDAEIHEDRRQHAPNFSRLFATGFRVRLLWPAAGRDAF